MSGGAWSAILTALAAGVAAVLLWIRSALSAAERRGYQQANGEAAIEIQKREDRFARERKRIEAEAEKRRVRHAEDLARLETAPTKRDVDAVVDDAGVTGDQIEEFIEGRRRR